MATALLLVSLVFIVALCEASRTPGWNRLALPSDADGQPLFQQAVADAINKLNPGWTASYNEEHKHFQLKEFKALLGVLPSPENKLLKEHHRHPKFPGKIPKEFDASKKWPQCKTITEIRDQGHCGSCWAFGAVEVLSDRFCIHTNESVSLSANDLVACCGDLCGDGCDGGWPYKAWEYFISDGIVTSNCQPYFDPVGCKHPGCEPVYPTPKCSKRCTDDELWTSAKHYAASVYVVGPKVEEIMAEVFINGPVEVDFDVYEDFAYYTGGVYKHVYGDMIGGHAVKLVGWGTTDDGIDYWRIANSWNKGWGEDGYFRIVRGTDDCGIESDVVAGLPSLKRHKAVPF